MNIKEVLKQTINFFKKYNIPQPQLDAEVLLAHLLDMERIQLYVNYDLPLKEDELSIFREMVKKRAKRVPVAYLTGHKEFMSLDISVNENVLIPRPETEILVEEVLSIAKNNNLLEPNIVDVGTGSGAIAVSLGYYLERAKIVGIDISDAALKVAQKNIDKYGLSDRVKVLKGDLLLPLIRLNKKNVDIIVSNPPYISDEEMRGLPPEVQHEPNIALTGGPDGLNYYKKIITQSQSILYPGGLLALEIGYNQAGEVKTLLNNWDNIKIIKDHAGHNRVVLATKSSKGF